VFVRRDVSRALRYDSDYAFDLGIIGRYALRRFIGIRSVAEGAISETMTNDRNDDGGETAV